MDTINFPLDICEWVAPDRLRSWVEEELGNLNGLAEVPDRQRALLAVLAFAYARGTFDSEEILDLCRTDTLYRALCGRTDFSGEDVRDARHKARGLLVTLVVRLLSRGVAQKLATPVASLSPALKRRLHESAVDRLDNARNMDRGEEE